MTPAKTIKNLQKGFTLIELLVVIGILAILLAIVLIAINPARQFAQANNTKRSSDVNSILNAVNQYMSDNKGNLPTGLTVAACPIATPCTITAPAGVATKIDLCAALVTTYMADLPTDPKNGAKSYNSGNCTQAGATYNTDYTIGVNSGIDNRITVTAPDAELGATITVTR
jgi:prepilin-type N-terminal cleavage/methylation domain-containing protein